MKKILTFLSLFCVLTVGTLFAEKHVLGFGATDVDIQGTIYTKVSLFFDESPAAAPGGFQLGDIIKTINGKDVSDSRWNDFRPILNSDSPTTFNFTVERNGTPVEVSLTSVPASSIDTKKYQSIDLKKINPNYKKVTISVGGDRGEISRRPKEIVGNAAYVQIRYSGETSWIYRKKIDLDEEGKCPVVKIPMEIDANKTLYVEMVYKSTDGSWYGDYYYRRCARIIQGSTGFKFFVWHAFKRKDINIDWNEQMGRRVNVKNTYIQFSIMPDEFKKYIKQGYTFPETATVTVIDTYGKQVYSEDLPAQVTDKVFRVSQTAKFKDLFRIDLINQQVEKDVIFYVTINAQKNGQPAPLKFKIREQIFTMKDNRGMYLDLEMFHPVYHIFADGTIRKDY